MEGLPPALREHASGVLLESTEYLWDLLEACWDGPSHRPVIGAVIDALNDLAGALDPLPDALLESFQESDRCS